MAVDLNQLEKDILETKERWNRFYTEHLEWRKIFEDIESVRSMAEQLKNQIEDQ